MLKSRHSAATNQQKSAFHQLLILISCKVKRCIWFDIHQPQLLKVQNGSQPPSVPHSVSIWHRRRTNSEETCPKSSTRYSKHQLSENFNHFPLNHPTPHNPKEKKQRLCHVRRCQVGDLRSLRQRTWVPYKSFFRLQRFSSFPTNLTNPEENDSILNNSRSNQQSVSSLRNSHSTFGGQNWRSESWHTIGMTHQKKSDGFFAFYQPRNAVSVLSQKALGDFNLVCCGGWWTKSDKEGWQLW